MSPHEPAFGLLAALLGVAMVGAISMVYLVRTIPSWCTWMTPASFFLTAVGLGAALSGGSVTETWNGFGLSHLGAAAAAAQVLLGLLRQWRFGVRPTQWLAAIAGALAVVVLLGLSHRQLAPGAAFLLVAELMNRQAFYDSHRRVGL